MGEVEAGQLDELPLGAQPLEEHDQLEPEEDHRVDGRSAAGRVAVLGPVPDKGEVEPGIKMTIEMAARNERLQ